MGRSVIDILEELESTPGSNARLSVLESAADNDLLKSVFLAAQDPYTVYYVNKFKMPKAAASSGSEDVTVQTFLDVIHEQLATRQVTGNAAKDLVQQVFSVMTAREQKWCQRVLLHNLRCGVQVSTVDKVWPGLIKPFSVALAGTLKSQFTRGKGIQLLEPVSYPVRVEPKLDGLRCIAVKQAGVVTFFTRNGTVLETLPRTKSALAAAPYDDMVLDGEAMGADWNESASVLMSSKSKKDDANITYNVFDAMPLADWQAQQTTLNYAERCSVAARIVNEINTMFGDASPVRLVDHVVAKDETELKRYFAQCMDAGYEGVMLKRTDTPYEWDRSRNILKLKPCVTYEGVVVGWYEGRRGAKWEGLFGGFYVLLPNHVITRVGGGFDNKFRADVQLDGPDTWLGAITECEAQPDPLTADGLSVDGKMRFPVYTRERDMADVDKSVTETWTWWLSLPTEERDARLAAVARV